MMDLDQSVSPLLQQELDERVAAAGGDILAVRHELEDELHRMEVEQEVQKRPGSIQFEIALHLAEIAYLDEKLHESGQETVAKHPGLLGRMRNWFGSRGPETS